MQKINKNKKSQLLKFGFFFLIIGILIISFIPLKILKEEVFEEMRLSILHLNKKNESDNTSISNVTINNIETKKIEETTPIKEQETKKTPNYNYIGELNIPKINLRKGFVSKESKYNNINYNITIAKEADYPDVLYGNFILMAHSGNAYISFFDKLYKLEIGDQASVIYNNNTYNYQLTNIYNQAKTGTVGIYRTPTKKTLTLITCTHNDDYNQTIYIFDEI